MPQTSPLPGGTHNTDDVVGDEIFSQLAIHTGIEREVKRFQRLVARKYGAPLRPGFTPRNVQTAEECVSPCIELAVQFADGKLKSSVPAAVHFEQ